MRFLQTALILVLVSSFGFAAFGFASDAAPALLAAGRVDDAISTLQQEISASPNDAAAYNLLCRAYFSLSQWDRGIAACEKAVFLDPNNSLYHLWLGRIYGEKADASVFFTAEARAKRARIHLDRTVQLGPAGVVPGTAVAWST